MSLEALFCDIDDFCQDFLPQWERAQHARSLAVHPYPFRAHEVPPAYDSLREELARCYYFYDVDSVFTDRPDIAVRVTELTDIQDWVEGLRSVTSNV